MGSYLSNSSNSGMLALSEASFRFFLEVLSDTSSTQGCFLSPLSIMYALSLALNGAGPQSTTHAELLRIIAGPSGQRITESDLNSVLGRAMMLLKGQSAAQAEGPITEIFLANSLWTQRGTKLKDAYVKSMKTLFQATAHEAVNGAKDINSWVEDATHGMIKDLIQTEIFDAVLANAIYFKGLWEHAFQPDRTQLREFTTASGERKQVSMMHQMLEGPVSFTGVRKEGLYDAVSLPYKGGTFSAVALLPAKGVEMAVALKDWVAGPQEFKPLGRVMLAIPKFKVASSLSLAPVLKGLGVQTAFSAAAADFSRIADGRLYISDVVHKAIVEVDEEGTVASAATAVLMVRCLPPEIVFNRPFAFVIYHNPTGLPVFVGVINDPSSSAA